MSKNKNFEKYTKKFIEEFNKANPSEKVLKLRQLRIEIRENRDRLAKVHQDSIDLHIVIDVQEELLLRLSEKVYIKDDIKLVLVKE